MYKKLAEGEELMYRRFRINDNTEETNITVDEKGNSFISLTRIQWGNGEADESKAKLNIRQFAFGEGGKEIVKKGVTFLTEEGPHELTNTMVNVGYGSTEKILSSLIKRDDFSEAVNNIKNPVTNQTSDNSDIIDFRSCLLDDIIPSEDAQ